MDFFEPEVQETYDKCKYTVKVWEHKFKKKYKRIPSKHDIKEATYDVRNAYRKYFRLKSIILDHSFIGVEGFDDIDDENDSQEITSDSAQFPLSNEPNTIVPLNPQNIDDKIWGSHLNKKEDVDESKIETEEAPKINLNISKKLFCGSKLSKRNPRKALLSSHKNKNIATEKTTLSQPTTPLFSSFSSEEALSALHNDSSESLFTDISYSVGSLTQPTNAVQTFLGSNSRPLRTVDAGWLHRVTQITGKFQDDIQTESTKFDYDSDDIIENSDEEDSCKHIIPLHIAKKRKVQTIDTIRNANTLEDPNKECLQQKYINSNRNELELEEKPEQNETCMQINTIELKELDSNQECIIENEVTELQHSTTKSECSVETEVTNLNKNDLVPEDPNQKNDMKISNKIIIKKTKTVSAVNKNKNGIRTPRKVIKTPKNNPETSQISPRRSSRRTKVKVSLQELSIGEEDAFGTDTDEKDPEFTVDSDTKKKVYKFGSDNEETPKKLTTISKTKREKGKKKAIKSIDNSVDEENDTYDLEFSIRPRVVTSRYDNIKNILSKNKIVQKEENTMVDQTKESDNVGYKNKQQQAKEKLQHKITSGSLNDNFVRIDIKKKIFVRGKSKMNFKKFKKSQWKSAKARGASEMDMGGCDGGMLTCFNCGQDGHFARNCKASKGDSLLPLEADIEKCPFPTLEEATKLAQEGNLSIRTPKLPLNEIQNCDTQGNTNENSDNFIDDLDSEQLLLEAIKLEEHVKKLDVRMYMDTVTVVQPYYKLNEDDSLIDTPPEVFEVLRQFGHSSFRPGQEQAIMRILSGKSTLVTLSTGSGKSLCYQLPAYMYSKREPCISLVISPLVSLMDDQILGIAKFMKAACLHSNQTAAQRKKILEAISMGELSILLVSPEAVVSGEKRRGFSSFLRKLPPIAFACIDETHCVSQWSHNFRPSYLMICKVLRESLGVKTILGLTATATKATQASIIEHLHITDGEEGIIKDIPLPDNLQLSVSKDVNRDVGLLSLLLSERFKHCKSIVIYCTRRQECERVAAFLRASLKSEQPLGEDNKKRKRVRHQAEPYHAGLPASRRRTIQSAFMSGDLRIVVATVAFGMGINKSDIRAVIHYNMPSSFESYVQEVGRAGRDGLQAECHVFLDSKGNDENELRRHIHSNSIDHHVVRKLLENIFIPCSCKGQCPKHEVAFSIESTVKALDIPEENISTLLCYLELHANKYIELLSPAYTKCRVVSYSGPFEIRKMAKECPPLAMALALHKSKDVEDPNILEFPVIDVAAAMGWESGICKYKLKNLEWTVENGQPKRSTISVEFSDLGFRLFAPGNLEGEQLDEALESLYSRVVDQERTALLQLNAIHQTLLQVAKPSFNFCLEDVSDVIIKTKVREYFDSSAPLELVSEIKYSEIDEEKLAQDICTLISVYRDNSFTGKAIARIFQGIQSPNYPAAIWGRCKFWRKHLDKDFHLIVKIAARQIVKMRNNSVP